MFGNHSPIEKEVRQKLEARAIPKPHNLRGCCAHSVDDSDTSGQPQYSRCWPQYTLHSLGCTGLQDQGSTEATSWFTSLESLYSPKRTLAPLVHQQGRWLCVSWLDPGREEPPLVCLVPQILVQVGICDLLQGLHIVHRNKVAVEVHELNAHLAKKEIDQVPLQGKGLQSADSLCFEASWTHLLEGSLR